MGKITSKIKNNLSVTILTDIVDKGEDLFIYAPGSSSNVHDPFGHFLSQYLPQNRISLIRFHFPYQELGKRSPDGHNVLVKTWTEVLQWSQKYQLNTVIGGRSLGGKIASFIAPENKQIRGLALFAYPFHAPGRPAMAKNDHLSQIKLPVFFCTGARDTFADINIVRKTLSTIPNNSFTSLAEADHGFAPRKSASETQEELWSKATEAFINWHKTMH